MKAAPKIALLASVALMAIAPLAAGPRMRARIAEKLGLTAIQQQQVTQLRQQHQKEALALRHQMEERQLALRQEMEKENPSEAVVFKGIDDLSSLRAQMQKMRYRQRQAMQGLLTPEQLQKFRALREEHRGQRGPGKRGAGRHRMGMGPGPGGPPEDGFGEDEWAFHEGPEGEPPPPEPQDPPQRP